MLSITNNIKSADLRLYVEKESIMTNYNDIMKQLAQYNMIMEETSAVIEDLKDQLKQYMKENQLETLIGDDHKATYKAVVSSRLDTTKLKKDMPDVVAQYTKTTSSMRFLFS